MKYFWNLLISIDQFFNTLFGGDPDETISSRMGKWAKKGEPGKFDLRVYIGKSMARFLALFEKDHCEKSIEADEGNDEVLK